MSTGDGKKVVPTPTPAAANGAAAIPGDGKKVTAPPPAPANGAAASPGDGKKVAPEVPPKPAGELVQLPAPRPEPTDIPLPINLATALRLADGRPLIVAAAQAGAWSAEGQLQKAKVLWLPSFVVNAAYLRHDGPIDFNQGINIPPGINALGQIAPTSFGKPLDQNFNWFMGGASLYQAVALTDAIFQPLAARQDLNARRWDIQAAKNDALLYTTQAYFDVHKFRGQYAGALYTVERGHKLEDAITRLSKDLVPRVEVDRARNLVAFLEQQAVSARENWRVSSARLTRVLRLDPRAVVVPLEHDHLQITLIDPSRPLDELLPIGLSNRPELASQQATIQAAMVHIRQEKCRPLLPSIILSGWQTPGGMPTEIGAFGTGHGGEMNNWSTRLDASIQVVWQMQSLGFGNLALIKRARGEQSKATARLFQMQDSVAQEITTAQANLQSAAARVTQAERALRTGLFTFEKNLEGLGQTVRFGNVLHQVYRPQEVVFALKVLKLAFDEYYATVAEYNQAQFQLFHALGYPARDIEFLRPPDGQAPTDTSRPGFLPAVGTGPPPVAR